MSLRENQATCEVKRRQMKKMSEFAIVKSGYLQCKVCSKLFYTKTGLKIHSATDHGIVTAGGKGTKDRIPQLCHQSEVHIKNEYKNIAKNELDYIFTSNQNQAEEIFNDLDNLINNYQSEIKTLKHETCDKSLDINFNLLSHVGKADELRETVLDNPIIDVQEKSKPYQCQQCESSFGEKAVLKRHIKYVHDKLKPYQCLLCEQAFVQKYSLQLHIKIVHEKLKPHECLLCKKSFGNKCTLKNHIIFVHEKSKPYQCQICKKSFGHKPHLKSHIKTVHEKIKPYQCLVCKKYFGRKHYLQKHTINIHQKK